MTDLSARGVVGRWSGFLLVAAVAVGLGGCSASSSGSAAGPGTRPATPATPATAMAGQTIADLAYANASPQESLDLYLPVSTRIPAPLLIWVHGGGWRTGDKSSIAVPYDPSAVLPEPAGCTDVVQVQTPDVTAMTARGYAVASINYRLDRDPVEALRDAKAAVRYLRANAAKYHLAPDRFAAWGDSAGGYTVIMLGLTGDRPTIFDDPALGNPGVSSAVQAVVDWFGPTDAASMPGHAVAAQIPYTYLTARRSLPPFRIAHGDADCTVPLKESRHLVRALTKAGGVATLTVLPGARHEDPAFMRTQRAPTVAFLDQALAVG
jgi:acetyl esterase/lipase